MTALRLFVLFGCALAAAGCATVTTAGGKRLRVGTDAFAAYAEQVFREQNRVASRLAFAMADIEDDQSARYRNLAAAEDRLLDACAGLNEIAARRRDGERTGALRGLHAAEKAPACDRAAQAAAAALAE